jgi:ribose 5-phosphate isomerase B
VNLLAKPPAWAVQACRLSAPAVGARLASWQHSGMRVFVGSDHAGFELKGAVLADLTRRGHDAVDCGPQSYDPGDDYPPYCLDTASKVVAEPGSLGVVIGGSGNGEQIAANKVPGVRCALAYSPETAQLARRHNDANVVGIGARMHEQSEALDLVALFIDTPFSQDPRHQRRIDMLSRWEMTGEMPEVAQPEA